MVMMVMIILVISASAKAKLTGVSTEKLLGLLDKAELGDDESIAAMYMVGQGTTRGLVWSRMRRRRGLGGKRLQSSA